MSSTSSISLRAGDAFGRGVIVTAGEPVPDLWASAPIVTIDDAVLADPASTVATLHGRWAQREPVVVALAVDPATFRHPQSIVTEPWRLTPLDEPFFDRLHHLVWSNNYDGRTGELIWWWATKAARLIDGAGPLAPGDDGDVVDAAGERWWIDGGPRQVWPDGTVDGHRVIAAESIELGTAEPTAPLVAPSAELAADQLAAVAHGSGAARIIAPAGSGKTRVLTERLRHLIADRGYERAGVVAVAYNKQAQLEMSNRTATLRPHVRTLNSLALWVLTEHRGSAPPVVDEREVRRAIESIVPGRWRRRSNTDPIAPYVEALSTVRLGLRDPESVEAERDDIDGFAELFAPYREWLQKRGAVDFDEQIYAAIETLLADGPFRRRVQSTCRHVLVDEFQDLTPAHLLLVRLLALPTLDVFGVGDDDQCIYGHAGADPGFLIDYERYFPDATKHALHVNYRCPAPVVEAAATLLGYNHRRVDKQIVAARPAGTERELELIDHDPDDAAGAITRVVQQWIDGGVPAATIAVLARVNSVLLAPHVALHEAGIPLQSTLSPDVLQRTGLRAALAYLRIASNPDGFAPADVVEILRRPTRGLPQWFPDRLNRRRSWTVGELAGISTQVSDKDSVKVLDLADDLQRIIAAAADAGTTRAVLESVRDDIGLGEAMSLLDRSGKGQGSSHLDDLDGLLALADLHPDPQTFEAWLQASFVREVDAEGVTLSTIHKVKGREWDHVAVIAVNDGLLPHRLSDDIEEERRVFHVGVTRGGRSVAVLADRQRRSPFLDELTGTAPKRPASAPIRSAGPPPGKSPSKRRAAADEAPLEGASAAAETALRAWRTERARADDVPAYIVFSDKTLRAIARSLPTSARELRRCDGIGPAKLERYGDDLLAIVAAVVDPG